ncbi:ABC transporter ATP-binding protein [Metabacillus idriensis]|uniref:ABC transporter ATP-binding protein n=1 Tax=Metabacillus idriensis TaxID=324768 RepID=UPI00281420B2|nr:ABC transporter ATP-binding protein [Metabacillus idriensis]MDR0137026.1 ABC transporter ATP-binding protein [Metabacillus idriensis]
MNDMIEIKGLTKRFKESSIFQDVNLSIRQGEIVSLVGPSGTGKTTLLRCIAGLEAADAGGVWIEGKDMSAVRAQKRPVVMMFQQPLLFSHMTVFENVEYGLKVMKEKKRKERVAEMLNRVDMIEFQSAYPHELSGGQQQRVALARALIISPKLVLLDEPFASLDPALRSRLRTWVRNLLKEQDTSALFVTHDMEEAMYMGDMTAIIANGSIQQMGTPEQLYLQPENQEAAAFFSEGLIIDETSFAHVKNLRMVRNESDHSPISFQAEVNHIVQKHGMTFYTLFLNRNGELLTLHSDLKADIGDSVFIEVIDPDMLCYFDEDMLKEETG